MTPPLPTSDLWAGQGITFAIWSQEVSVKLTVVERFGLIPSRRAHTGEVHGVGSGMEEEPKCSKNP